MNVIATTHPAGQPRDVIRRAAFTLTELLVVITIIAILAALATVGVTRALDTAKQTRIKAEIDQIDMALKQFKEKYGSYPPCNLAIDNDPAILAAVNRFIARAFPRYNLANLRNDLLSADVDLDNFRPDHALAFWLRGFSPDPANPFVTTADLQLSNGMPGTKVTRQQFFDFDTTRLQLVGTMYAYFPPGIKTDPSSGAPYLYWDSTFYGAPPHPTMPTEATPLAFNVQGGTQPYSSAGTASPCWYDTNGNFRSAPGTSENENWASADSFQIIATGMDGKYGLLVSGTPLLKHYPSGGNFDPLGTDDDNVTNFCDKARLGDARP